MVLWAADVEVEGVAAPSWCALDLEGRVENAKSVSVASEEFGGVEGARLLADVHMKRELESE